MLKVVGDGGINLRQRQRGKTVQDVLCGSSLLKRSDERVQGNARACYVNGAIALLDQRNCLCESQLLHRERLYTRQPRRRRLRGAKNSPTYPIPLRSGSS